MNIEEKSGKNHFLLNIFVNFTLKLVFFFILVILSASPYIYELMSGPWQWNFAFYGT